MRQGMSLPDLVRYTGQGSLANYSNSESPKQRGRKYPASEERKEELQPLTDLECIMAVTRVKGFDLAAKEWCE
jgi:hypothetical protein